MQHSHLPALELGHRAEHRQKHPSAVCSNLVMRLFKFTSNELLRPYARVRLIPGSLESIAHAIKSHGHGYSPEPVLK